MSWIKTVVKWALIAAGLFAGAVIAMMLFLFVSLPSAGNLTH